MRARILHAHQHLTPARQRGQRRQRLTRQTGNAEYDDAAWQPRRTRTFGPVRRALQERFVNRRAAARQRIVAGLSAARGLHFLDQRAPQRRLPTLLAGQRMARVVRVDCDVFAVRPSRQPVRPIYLILLEQIGDAIGQLIALAPVRVIADESPQRLELGAPGKRRNHVHEPPHEARLVERRYIRNFRCAQHRAIGLPDESRRQHDIERCGDAAAALACVGIRIGGEREFQPLRDTVALHEDDFVF